MAEMQRANIEFERQRHLANWLIKSSAHMAKPSQKQQILNPPSSQLKVNITASNNKNTPASIKTGTLTQNPIFFAPKSSLSKPSIFTSQTNLPLQIVTQSSDGHKPKLRRFNSHDTSTNMFSVVDFENARLARRNEIEKQKYKMNSLSSGGDCSTGDSKGSKFSNESNPEPLPVNVFLERYSLPRVIRLKYDDKFNTLLSSSSNDSGLSTDHKKSDKNGDLYGELLFLYRHVKSRNIYHGYNTRSSANKKKVVKIPQEYQGYFSFVNDRGQPTATMYTTMIQLVRERVYKFVTVENLPAYTEQQTDTFPTKSHYVKGTVKAGHIFRLLAVFQDGGMNYSSVHQHQQHHDSSNSSSANQNDGVGVINTTGRDKERGRYAQLLGENRQIVYVSLSMKGKFFEIEQSTPQILQRSSSLGKPAVPKKLNNECIHHISNIITPETELPITLKFISSISGCGDAIPENLTIYRVSTENSLIVCPIEETDSRSTLYLRKVPIQPDMILTKCFLGFENEQRMFANQNVQNLLKFCQCKYDNFQRLIEIEYNGVQHSDSHENGLKILRPLNFTKFLSRDKIGHEKEDSIIFLTKNDLDNLEIHQQQKQLRKEEEIEIQTSATTHRDNQENQATISDKMKVFQSNTHKKKWFKNFNYKNSTTNSTRIAASSFTSLDDFMDLEQKRRSMDRYQDMSRLIQERFGGNIEFDSINHENINDENSRPSSETGVNPSLVSNQTNLTKKSMSLQDVVDRNLTTGNLNDTQTKSLSKARDLVKLERAISISNTIDDSERDSLSMSNGQQSFISQKLFNEFHVKTKNHSKSSSNLHQLLHFAIPQKMSINQMSKKKLHKSKSVTIPLPPPSNISHPIPLSTLSAAPPILTVEDDLPYSNVRDSLLADQTNKNCIAENAQIENSSHLLNYPFEEIQNENIYAEICNDSPVSSPSTNSNQTIANHDTNSSSIGSGDSIRISISATHHGHNVDNIYNTIK